MLHEYRYRGGAATPICPYIECWTRYSLLLIVVIVFGLSMTLVLGRYCSGVDLWMFECSDVEIFECWGVGMLGGSGIGTFGCWDVRMLERSDVRTSDVGMFGPLDVRQKSDQGRSVGV